VPARARAGSCINHRLRWCLDLRGLVNEFDAWILEPSVISHPCLRLGHHLVAHHGFNHLGSLPPIVVVAAVEKGIFEPCDLFWYTFYT